MSNDIETLETVCTVVFGNNWQRALSREINVSDRTVRYWVAGRNPVPRGIWAELEEIARKHQQDAAKAVDLIKSHREGMKDG